MSKQDLEKYWTTRYKENRTGWDIGYPSTPIKEYIDQLDDKEIKILIPGAGNAYEAEYIYNKGFNNISVLDISKLPLKSLKRRVVDFPDSQLIHENFFDHKGQYDLILEQTFFCSFEPSAKNRKAYFKQMADLLKPGAHLVGLWFDHPLTPESKRPFGGNKEEYLSYVSHFLEVAVFERCYNSIKPRLGKELFGIFRKATLEPTLLWRKV